MALPCKRQHTPDSSLLLIYRPRKDERLSWPSWLTCSGWLTHISGHPSATGRAQDRESSPVRDRRSSSTTVPRHQLVFMGIQKHTNTRPISTKFNVGIHLSGSRSVCLCVSVCHNHACMSHIHKRLNQSRCGLGFGSWDGPKKPCIIIGEQRPPGEGAIFMGLFPGVLQCRINHVADVADATGLSGASGSREIFFSPSVVK